MKELLRADRGLGLHRHLRGNSRVLCRGVLLTEPRFSGSGFLSGGCLRARFLGLGA